jgi:hypothetical protein
MKAGKYWIGDLCYVMHGEWDRFCELTLVDNECLHGQINVDGKIVASYGTAYGDGEYFDNDGHSYGVDAGLIGCIRLEDIDLNHKDNDVSLGRVVNFPHDFATGEDSGKIRFGHITVDTNPEEDEDDEADQEAWYGDHDEEEV